jgi:hypothetical protein
VAQSASPAGLAAGGSARWAALGHLEPVDETLLAIYVETVAMRQRVLDQLREEDLSHEPVAIKMLRDINEDIDNLRAELLLL